MSDHGEDGYKVGKGRPPKETRFQKGRSGNPAGRPKKKQATADLIKRELGQSVRLTNGDVITVREALIKAGFREMAQGKLKQWPAVFAALQLYDPKPEFAPTRRDEELLLKALGQMAAQKKPDGPEQGS